MSGFNRNSYFRVDISRGLHVDCCQGSETLVAPADY